MYGVGSSPLPAVTTGDCLVMESSSRYPHIHHLPPPTHTQPDITFHRDIPDNPDQKRQRQTTGKQKARGKRVQDVVIFAPAIFMQSWCANRKPDNERSESNDGKIQVSEVGGSVRVVCQSVAL